MAVSPGFRVPANGLLLQHFRTPVPQASIHRAGRSLVASVDALVLVLRPLPAMQWDLYRGVRALGRARLGEPADYSGGRGLCLQPGLSPQSPPHRGRAGNRPGRSLACRSAPGRLDGRMVLALSDRPSHPDFHRPHHRPAAPPDSRSWGLPIATPGSERPVPCTGTYAGPDYLHTLRVPILAGRDFSSADLSSQAAVAVINRKLAHALWPDRPALGRVFILGASQTPIEVIGVVPDAAFSAVGSQGEFSGLAPAATACICATRETWPR
jgi:hypothetical protein